jgi:mono/diheme cytochrome c family protein
LGEEKMATNKNFYFNLFFIISLSLIFLSTVYTSNSLAKDSMDLYGDMLEDDMVNPFEGDEEAIAIGYERFNSRCSYCHGMRGIGAKGPPLTRGYYKVSGGTNINLYSTIASGLTINGRPTQMGAFSRTIEDDDIWRIIAYMRQEYKDRKAAGSNFKYGVYP